MKQRSLAAIAALSCAFLLAAAMPAAAQSGLDRIKSKGVLVVATDPGWPPSSWRNEAGAFEGALGDLAHERFVVHHEDFSGRAHVLRRCGARCERG